VAKEGCVTIPVEPDGPTWKFIALGAWAVVTALFSWIAKSLRDEQKEQGMRIDMLERTYVSREELDRHVERLEAASQRMHTDNQAALIRIEEKVERGAQTRHDIRESIHTMQLMLRATLEKLKKGPDG
jgi:hypothetical protein